jgi:hypothetical protein
MILLLKYGPHLGLTDVQRKKHLGSFGRVRSYSVNPTCCSHAQGGVHPPAPCILEVQRCVPKAALSRLSASHTAG